MSPVFIFCMVCVIVVMCTALSKRPTIIVEQPVYEYNLEAVKYATYQKALTGDRMAREWVLENIFDTNAKHPATNPQKETKLTTDRVIINEAKASLLGLGMTRKEAAQKVKSLTANKYYNSLDDLIKDCFKKC